MIGKHLQKIWQLTILIAVRQVVFFGKNVYNLYYQPYLTIKRLVDDEDKSQIFLIAAAAVSPIAAYTVLRVVTDLWRFGRVVPLTGRVFTVMISIQILLLSYLGYWTLKVFKK